MFKQSYLEFLRSELQALTPSGYTIKVVEEYGSGASRSPKFEIKCYVKFGVGSKQINTSDRINQPVMFTVLSEGDDFRVANGIFNDFFYMVSRTHTTLNIDDQTYDLWHNYNTPIVQAGVNQDGTFERKTILMTGVVSYSLEKVIGVKYKIAEIPSSDHIQPYFIDVAVINPQTQYNTQVITPQYLNSKFGYAEIEGANNTFTFQMLLDKTSICKKLLDTSIKGTPLKIILWIEYNSDLIYTSFARVTSVVNSHDTATGDNILTVTCMPIKAEV